MLVTFRKFLYLKETGSDLSAYNYHDLKKNNRNKYAIVINKKLIN